MILSPARLNPHSEDDRDRFAREFRPVLLRMFRALTGDPALAEDLAQRAVLRALEALPTRREGNLRAWVCRVGYREFLHALRDSRPTASLDASTPSTFRLSPDALVLEAAIASLSPELRDVFVLREVQRLSVREASSALEVPEGTVKSRLSAAKAALRLALKDTWNA